MLRRFSSLVFVVGLLIVVALVAFPGLRKALLDWLRELWEAMRDQLGEWGEALGNALLDALKLDGGLGVGIGQGNETTPGIGSGKAPGEIPGGSGGAGSGGTGGGSSPHPCAAHGGHAEWELYDEGAGAEPRYRWFRPGTYTGRGTRTGYYQCADGWSTLTQSRSSRPKQTDPCSAAGRGWAVEYVGNGKWRCGDGTILTG